MLKSLFTCVGVPTKLLKKDSNTHSSVDTGRKLNVHKTFRRRPGRLLNALSTFNLRPVSTGTVHWGISPPLKNPTTLFFVKPPPKPAICPSPPFWQIPPIYWFFVTSPPLKIGFYSEPP